MKDGNPFAGRAFVIAPDDDGNLRAFNDRGEPLPFASDDDLQQLENVQSASRGSSATGIIRKDGRCYTAIVIGGRTILVEIPCP